MTVKEAVAILKKFTAQKFKCVASNDTVEALDFLDSQNRCFNCGKKMKQVGAYEWQCVCMKNTVISKG